MFVVDKKRNAIKRQLQVNCLSCKKIKEDLIAKVGGNFVETNPCNICIKKMQFVDKLADSNIPTNYWFLKMKDFTGPENVKKSTLDYAQNLDKFYNDGKGLCYTGQYGTGKTYSICSILKHALIKGYSAYYTSLTDMIHYMSDFSTQAAFYQMVTKADFLAIDEVDSRHFSDSEQAQQYFGSSFERIVRYRTQNGLPVIIASNNSSLNEVFSGQYKRVIDSLLNNATEVVPSLGKDHRKA